MSSSAADTFTLSSKTSEDYLDGKKTMETVLKRTSFTSDKLSRLQEEIVSLGSLCFDNDTPAWRVDFYNGMSDAAREYIERFSDK